LRSAGPSRSSRVLLGVGALFAAVAFASPAGASLAGPLGRALVTPGVSSSATGAFVFDLARSATVYKHNATTSLRPASNEKLMVAATALARLGPDSRIPTRVLAAGAIDQDGVWHGRLVLKGFGDPSLSGKDLAVLAAKVHALGIDTVDGKILGDESYFDTVRVGPGWKTSYYKDESPPLSALVVNRARFDGRVVGNPALAAARLFRRALLAEGVAVRSYAEARTAGPAATPIAQVQSAPLAYLVQRMNRISDNFYAEMLLKLLGARLKGSGTTADGARVVRAQLRNRGVTMAGVRIADGSGLSAYDRLTAKAIVQLLISAYSDSRISGAFVASLPLAGVNGTLKDRLRTPPAYRHVRAKTGTTDRASTLSGYVRTRYVFSILQNGNPIPWWYARTSQDHFVQILAGAS
jgi:serine-type D-Ala-D-Ala carboxypeptidase/endopeptidase (penicillin-binding protein 4)